MNPEIKKLWVDAARSGKYEQIYERLYDGHNGTIRCCFLGILCDISGLGDWNEDGEYLICSIEAIDADMWTDFVYSAVDRQPDLGAYIENDDDAARLPKTMEELSKFKIPDWVFRPAEAELHPLVSEWAGLDDVDPWLKSALHPDPRSIVRLNDYDALSFAALAQLVDEQL